MKKWLYRFATVIALAGLLSACTARPGIGYPGSCVPHCRTGAASQRHMIKTIMGYRRHHNSILGGYRANG